MIKYEVMALRIYNSLTHEKEAFTPVTEGRVRLYVCGVTAYSDSHIGHARSAIVFDVISRYLRASGYDVVYVRNFTDIDDKIINRANAEKGAGKRSRTSTSIPSRRTWPPSAFSRPPMSRGLRSTLGI